MDIFTLETLTRQGKMMTVMMKIIIMKMMMMMKMVTTMMMVMMMMKRMKTGTSRSNSSRLSSTPQSPLLIHVSQPLHISKVQFFISVGYKGFAVLNSLAVQYSTDSVVQYKVSVEKKIAENFKVCNVLQFSCRLHFALTCCFCHCAVLQLRVIKTKIWLLCLNMAKKCLASTRQTS